MWQQFHMSTATTSFSKSKSVMDVSAHLGHRIWLWQRPLILKRADIHGKNQPWQASVDLRERACKLRSTACLCTVAQSRLRHSSQVARVVPDACGQAVHADDRGEAAPTTFTSSPKCSGAN